MRIGFAIARDISSCNSEIEDSRYIENFGFANI